MSEPKKQEFLFQLKSGTQSKSYSLAYEETEAANVNFELLSSVGADGKKDELVISKDSLPTHLKPGVDVTVIDSVNSGVGREKREFYTSVLEPILNELDIKHTLLKTTSALSITNFAKSLDLSKDHTVVLLSGDTSVVEFINGLPTDANVSTKPNINLVLIPLGTGNALVSSSGITSEANAVQKMFSNEKAELPLYEADFPSESFAVHLENAPPIGKLLFTIVLSWGSHAQMVYHAESPELKGLGIERFKIAAYKIFQQKLEYNCDIIIVDENGKEEKMSHSTTHNYSSILAVPRLEKKYHISPDSKISKSELHILDFGDLPKDEFMGLLMEPYKGAGHVNHKGVIYEPIQPKKQIILELGEEDEERSIVCVDGISIKVKNGKGKRITVRFVNSEDLSFKLNLVGLQ